MKKLKKHKKFLELFNAGGFNNAFKYKLKKNHAAQLPNAPLRRTLTTHDAPHRAAMRHFEFLEFLEVLILFSLIMIIVAHIVIIVIHVVVVIARRVRNVRPTAPGR